MHYDYSLFRFVKEPGKPEFDQELNELRQVVPTIWASTDKCESGFHEILLVGDLLSHLLVRRLLVRFHPHYKWVIAPDGFYGDDLRANADAVRNYLIASGGFGTDPEVNILGIFSRYIIGNANMTVADRNGEELILDVGAGAGAGAADLAIHDDPMCGSPAPFIRLADPLGLTSSPGSAKVTLLDELNRRRKLR